MKKKLILLVYVVMIVKVVTAQWVMTHNFGSSLYFSQITFTENNVGYILDLQNKNVYKSVDDGSTWSIVNQSPLPSYPIYLCFTNDTVGFVGGSNYLQKTTDGGVTWSNIFSSSINIKKICFPSDSVGYLCGSNKIYKSTDLGNNWFDLTVPNYIMPIDIYFTNDSTGFAISDTAKGIYKTIDGGFNWSFVSIPTLIPLKSCEFLDEVKGFAYNETEIYKTNNEGISWNLITSGGFSNSLIKCVFIDEFHIYAVPYGNYMEYLIYYSDDGGLNWNQQSYLADDVWVNDIVFINDTTGYCVGGDKYDGTINGIIIKTTNGGITGNQEIKQQTKNIIYPNPATDEINVITNNLNQTNSISIINQLGQIERKLEFNNEQVRIDIRELRNGMYFVKLNNGENMELYKIIKE